MLSTAGRRSKTINIQTVEMLISDGVEPSYKDFLRSFDQITGGYRAKSHLPADNDNFPVGEDDLSELEFD